jgi:hypothetical protein
VHVDAVGAAVELRRPDPDELAQPVVDAGGVELLGDGLVEVGETEQRLYALPAWRETPFFTLQERAALSFTETVTRVSETHVPTEAYDEIAAQFSPPEVAALLGLITAINAWNAVSVASRAWVPGSYNP